MSLGNCATFGIIPALHKKIKKNRNWTIKCKNNHCMAINVFVTNKLNIVKTIKIIHSRAVSERFLIFSFMINDTDGTRFILHRSNICYTSDVFPQPVPHVQLWHNGPCLWEHKPNILKYCNFVSDHSSGIACSLRIVSFCACCMYVSVT